MKWTVPLQTAANAGIGMVAMKTMAGGWLDKEKTRPVNTAGSVEMGTFKSQYPHNHTRNNDI